MKKSEAKTAMEVVFGLTTGLMFDEFEQAYHIEITLVEVDNKVLCYVATDDPDDNFNEEIENVLDLNYTVEKILTRAVRSAKSYKSKLTPIPGFGDVDKQLRELW